jgi:hypothetical protein
MDTTSRTEPTLELIRAGARTLENKITCLTSPGPVTGPRRHRQVQAERDIRAGGLCEMLRLR